MKLVKISKVGFRNYTAGNFEIVSWERNGKLGGWIVRSLHDRYNVSDPIATLREAKVQLRLAVRYDERRRK